MGGYQISRKKALRNTLRIPIYIAGDCQAIDFVKRDYSEGMDVLEHHIKPLRTIPGVVLEQA